MNQNELNKILKEHKLWIASVGGAKADFSNADLTGANLRNADLTGANLRNVDLTGANLRGANLEGVNLKGATLKGVDLRGANIEFCWVSPGTKILGNVIITDFDQYNSFWEVLSWVELDKAGLGEALYV